MTEGTPHVGQTEDRRVDDRQKVVDFFKDARSFFSKDDIAKHLLVTKRSVFVDEMFEAALLQGFQKWLEGVAGKSLRLDLSDLRRKLLGSEHPHAVYVIQGGSVGVGFEAPCPTTELRSSGIKLYEGIPLDTSRSIHQKDPIFQRTEGLSAEVVSGQGLSAVIVRKGRRSVLPFVFLERFYAWLQEGDALRQEFPRRGLRSLVSQFLRISGRIRPFPTSIPLLMPTRLWQKKFDLLLLRGVVLVRNEGIYLDFFPLRGRAYRDFVKQEIAAAILTPKVSTVGSARVRPVKGGFSATAMAAGIVHTIGYGVVFSYLDEIMHFARTHKGRTPGKLGERFDIKAVIAQLSNLLREAQPIMPDKAPASFRNECERDWAFLSVRGEWFFAVDRRKMIRACSYAKKRPRKQLELKHLTREDDHERHASESTM